MGKLEKLHVEGKGKVLGELTEGKANAFELSTRRSKCVKYSGQKTGGKTERTEDGGKYGTRKTAEAAAGNIYCVRMEN